MNARSAADTVPERNRTLTMTGVGIIALSIGMAVWLATAIGDFVTAAWMALFVLVGLVFISLGRNAGRAS